MVAAEGSASNPHHRSVRLHLHLRVRRCLRLAPHRLFPKEPDRYGNCQPEEVVRNVKNLHSVHPELYPLIYQLLAFFLLIEALVPLTPRFASSYKTYLGATPGYFWSHLLTQQHKLSCYAPIPSDLLMSFTFSWQVNLRRKYNPLTGLYHIANFLLRLKANNSNVFCTHQ